MSTWLESSSWEGQKEDRQTDRQVAGIDKMRGQNTSNDGINRGNLKKWKTTHIAGGCTIEWCQQLLVPLKISKNVYELNC